MACVHYHQIIDVLIIIGQTRMPEVFEREYEARITDELIPAWCIKPNMQLLVLMSDYNRNFYTVNYGLVPFYSSTKNFVYQAPIHTGYTSGEEGIFKKNIIYSKPFRLPIREQRAIVPADYFVIVQKTKAMLFFHQDRSTIALGGIYDFWTNKNNAEDTNTGVAILTIKAYGLFKQLGLEYAPFLVHNRSKRWIYKKSHLNDITSMMQPYPDKLINGYEISVNNLSENSKLFAQPISKYFKPRWSKEYRRTKKGESHSRTPIESTTKWGDRKRVN